MKKIYILLITSLFCFNKLSHAQFTNCITVSDQILLTKLTTLYPACFAGHPGFMDTTCNAIVTATSLNIGGSGSGNDIQDISPIQYFDSLKYLDCSHNSLSTIYYPSHLESLKCNGQVASWLINFHCLHGLSDLPATIRVLDCSFNAISSLPTLLATFKSIKDAGNVGS